MTRRVTRYNRREEGTDHQRSAERSWLYPHCNNIRPVVMEIPDFEMGEWLDAHRKRQRFLYRIYSYFNGVVEDDIAPFRNGLKEMLKDTRLCDSVLFIPADHWIPQNHHYSEEIYQEDHVHINYRGYHVLDSCIVSEIISDYNQRIKAL